MFSFSQPRRPISSRRGAAWPSAPRGRARGAAGAGGSCAARWCRGRRNRARSRRRRRLERAGRDGRPSGATATGGAGRPRAASSARSSRPVAAEFTTTPSAMRGDGGDAGGMAPHLRRPGVFRMAQRDQVVDEGHEGGAGAAQRRDGGRLVERAVRDEQEDAAPVRPRQGRGGAPAFRHRGPNPARIGSAAPTAFRRARGTPSHPSSIASSSAATVRCGTARNPPLRACATKLQLLGGVTNHRRAYAISTRSIPDGAGRRTLRSRRETSRMTCTMIRPVPM